ncbi:c-type cytochrome [Deminuibacter soli]|uniref:Cytochrome c n=1 Tax=Deminuibacter soli TaxID=2291815 RepID=A0A3E1NEV6_9BACT|nr:cytochrome c [Deminuibacter soli]RFM26407.1 cytochrome c [Deminuibacter soli]
MDRRVSWLPVRTPATASRRDGSAQVKNLRFLQSSPSERTAGALYAQLCAGCHGADLKGKDNIPSLADRQWIYGGTSAAIQKSISQGVISKGMPAWEGVLSSKETAQLAAYILQHQHK